VFDPELVGRLEGTAFALEGYRNQPRGFDPGSGEGARRRGGRFNPAHSFPVLYLCTTRPCVVAEFTRQVERQGLSIEGFLPREVDRVTASLTKVLDLTDTTVLEALGVVADELVRDDWSLTQEIGQAAYEHKFQAILSRSATGVDDVVAVMPENLRGAVLKAELIEEWALPADLDG
jgi:RES domain-containing protein